MRLTIILGIIAGLVVANMIIFFEIKRMNDGYCNERQSCEEYKSWIFK